MEIRLQELTFAENKEDIKREAVKERTEMVACSRDVSGNSRQMHTTNLITRGPFFVAYQNLPGRCLVCKHVSHVINIPKADWSSMKNKQLTAMPCQVLVGDEKQALDIVQSDRATMYTCWLSAWLQSYRKACQVDGDCAGRSLDVSRRSPARSVFPHSAEAEGGGQSMAAAVCYRRRFTASKHRGSLRDFSLHGD